MAASQNKLVTCFPVAGASTTMSHSAMVSHSKSGARCVKISWRGVLELHQELQSETCELFRKFLVPRTFAVRTENCDPEIHIFHSNQAPSTGIWCSHGSDDHL